MQLPDGYYQLPPGKMANAVTWLELRDLSRHPGPIPADFRLQRLTPADAALHRTLYRTIGAPWLWSGLIDKSPTEMAEYIGNPSIRSFAVFDGRLPIGLLDLEIDAKDGVEIVYFGLVPDRTGQGGGAWLMDEAIRITRECGHARLWLHTCNFDHPKALAFYRRQGFSIYAQGFEIMDDPRRKGLLPEDAAPQVPYLPVR